MIKKKYEIVIISIASIIYCLYCNWIMTELPHLAWFDFMPLIDKYYTKTLFAGDLFSRYGEHGMFGYNVLLLINTELFRMTTFFDVYLNDFCVIVSGILVIFLFRKIVDNSKISYKIGVILIALFHFSTIQKSSGAMETQVRLGIFFFLLSSILVDRIFISTKSDYKKVAMACFFIIISINVFGTFYNFAGLPMIFIIGFIIFVTNKKKYSMLVPILATYALTTLVYIYEYKILAQTGVDSAGALDGIINLFTQPIMVTKSLIAYNANGLFGASVFLSNKYPVELHLWLGLIATSILCFAVYQYFKIKMYQKTYIPLFLIAYSLGVFVFVFIGRADLDWTWFLNEWYAVHIKLQYVGVVFILIECLQSEVYKERGRKVLCCVGGVCIALISLAGNYFELDRAGGVAAYYEGKQAYLFVKMKEELPVDGSGNTPLIASADVTFNAITILKKYGLSVYEYYPIYMISSEGYGNNDWIEKEAIVRIYTKTGKINLKMICPFEYDGSQSGTLYVDGNEYSKYSFENGEINLLVEVDEKSIVTLEFKNNYLSKTSDEKDVSFKLGIQ
ncbi:MAG: hypothetical protein H2184_04610 [Candidatus Galacturonibacter soehngenii]|nr:hypothetical protein [Candidatus Galacturonibacter soehngenii]